MLPLSTVPASGEKPNVILVRQSGRTDVDRQNGRQSGKKARGPSDSRVGIKLVHQLLTAFHMVAAFALPSMGRSPIKT
ncbi:hypothetical protein ASD54_10080 [Rhizobium sp. Root149]|nr:hypothetical protein ASD54_10080 [Rhizobium sp. Root149]